MYRIFYLNGKNADEKQYNNEKIHFFYMDNIYLAAY